MLAKRIIPCLDIRDGRVVKGIEFTGHRDIGDPVALASYYSMQGADELVFYDITASPQGRETDLSWVQKVAAQISIPFSVAGGIRSVDMAKRVFDSGADKISINTPALERPELINELVTRFGSQAIVIGIDVRNGQIYQNTGDPDKTSIARKSALDWIAEVQDRGAGELVINSMAMDGVRDGYDLGFLQMVKEIARVPVIASGGAGVMQDFFEVFDQGLADGALAASVFHSKEICIPDLKNFLYDNGIQIRNKT